MSLDEDRKQKLLRRAAAIGRAISIQESELLRYIQSLGDDLLKAAADGKKDASIELPIHAWLAIIDEIKGRRPRNYSQLIADDTIERFIDIWDKLGGLVTQLSLEVRDLQAAVKRIDGK